MLDTDKCLIDNEYHYQPKNDKEIRNFLYIEVNTPVRISLYRKKNSNAQWKVAHLILDEHGPCNRATRYSIIAKYTNNKVRIIVIIILHRVLKNETVQVHLQENQPTVQVDDNNGNDKEDLMTVEVLGEMPKVVGFELESTFQVYDTIPILFS